MLVSVVIPSVLRPEIGRAIKSVRKQEFDGDIEVVVVADRDEMNCSPEELDHLRGADIVEFTGGGKKGGYARNLGAARAGGEWIAFLDDDDEWKPNKLAIQFEALEAYPGEEKIVLASRVQQRLRGKSELSTPVPRTCFSEGKIEEYLFRGRRPTLGRAGIWPSTLLLPTPLARKIKWNQDLSRHQDWDWLLRLQREGRSRIVQLSDALVVIEMGTAGSISASADWRASLQWAQSYRALWDPQVFVDFVCGQSLRYAFQSRSLKGLRLCIGEMMSSRRLPSVGPALLGLGGVIPRGGALGLTMLIQRMRSRGEYK